MAATAHIVDMTDVKDGGGAFNKARVPSGDYLAKIVKVDDATVKDGDNKGQPQWLFTVVLEDYKSRKYPYYCTLVPNQLWKVRNLCTAVGIAVPKKRVKIDPNRLLNKLIAVTMEDDEYNGREQSVIAAVFPASELEPQSAEDIEDEDEDEDEVEAPPAPKARVKKAAAPEPEPEDDEEDDEEDEEPAPPPVRKKKRAAAPPPPPEDDEDEDDEEDDEEEPPPPPRKRAAKKATAKRATDEELDELDLDDL
jgi:hypothetical protein